MIHIDYPYIDDEEREIIESLNRGEWSPVSDEEYARIATMLYNAARNYFGLPLEENPVIPPASPAPAASGAHRTVARRYGGIHGMP